MSALRPSDQLEQAHAQKQEADPISNQSYGRIRAWAHACRKWWVESCLQRVIDPLADSAEEQAARHKKYGPFNELIDWGRQVRDCGPCTEEGKGLPPVLHFKPGVELQDGDLAALKGWVKASTAPKRRKRSAR